MSKYAISEVYVGGIADVYGADGTALEHVKFMHSPTPMREEDPADKFERILYLDCLMKHPRITGSFTCDDETIYVLDETGFLIFPLYVDMEKVGEMSIPFVRTEDGVELIDAESIEDRMEEASHE